MCTHTFPSRAPVAYILSTQLTLYPHHYRLPRLNDTFSICSWNIHANLAKELSTPQFCDIIKEHDIILLQETFLCPEQEDSLHLPDGYVIFALSQENSAGMAQQGGGVATIVQSSLAPKCLPCTAKSDLLPILIGNLMLINVYIPSCSFSWTAGDDGTPEQPLNECLAGLLEHADNMDLCVMGDLNARTASVSSHEDAYPRTSPNHGSISVRGCWLLQTTQDTDLIILNSTLLHQASSRDAFTSYQANWMAIVDYVLAHRLTLEQGHILNISTCAHLPALSDHAAIITKYAHHTQLRGGPQLQRSTYTAVPPPPSLGPRGPLDELLDVTLLAGKADHPSHIHRLYSGV